MRRPYVRGSTYTVTVPRADGETTIPSGDNKSEEPYSADDLKLLQAIARQIAVSREYVRLKDRNEASRLKPPSDDPSASESSLLGGRRAAAKPASKSKAHRRTLASFAATLALEDG